MLKGYTMLARVSTEDGRAVPRCRMDTTAKCRPCLGPAAALSSWVRIISASHAGSLKLLHQYRHAVFVPSNMWTLQP